MLVVDTQTAKVLAEAEKIAKQAGDSFVTVERLLTALAVTKSGAERRAEGGGRHGAGAERGDQRHPQGPHRRHRERRAGL